MAIASTPLRRTSGQWAPCAPVVVSSHFSVSHNIVVSVAVYASCALQLSATDVSARTTMKGAAKCDKHCELQNSVNQQVLERILRFRDIPESMPASVSTLSHSHPVLIGVSFCAPRRTCARDAFSVSSSNAMTFDCAHFVFSICQSDWCWLYSRSGVQSKT